MSKEIPYADRPATLKLRQDCFAVVRKGKPNYFTSFSTLEENAKYHAHRNGGTVVPCFIIDKPTVETTDNLFNALRALKEKLDELGLGEDPRLIQQMREADKLLDI